jgi:hypothetical protein
VIFCRSLRRHAHRTTPTRAPDQVSAPQVNRRATGGLAINPSIGAEALSPDHSRSWNVVSYRRWSATHAAWSRVVPVCVIVSASSRVVGERSGVERPDDASDVIAGVAEGVGGAAGNVVEGTA